MATFNHISGQEPSTISFKAATITQTRNSSVMHQEIISLGDPDSSLAIAAVLNAVPASTAWGVVTREAGGTLSSVGGIVQIQGNSTAVLSIPAAYISSAVLAGGSSALSVRNVWSSTAADQPVRAVFSSTGTDNPVTVSGFAAGMISSAVLAGGSSALNVRPVWSSTSTDQPVSVGSFAAGLISSAVNAGNSSALKVTVVRGASSAADFPVTVTAGTSSNSSQYVGVRITNGTAFIDPVAEYVHGSTLTDSTVSAGALMLRASSTTPPPVSTSDMFTVAWGSKNGALATFLATDAGVSIMDSTNRALNVNVVAGAAGGSTIVTVAAFGAGLLSSAAVGSNSSALNVRIVGGTSSGADFPVTISAGNSSVTVAAFAAGLLSSAAPAGNSSALLVRIVGGPSSAADCVIKTLPNSTLWASSAGFHFDSSGALQTAASFTGSTGPLTISQLLDSSGGSVTAADSANQAIRVNVVAGAAGGSTIVTVSAFGAGLLSSAAVGSNSSALNVRVVGHGSSAADFPVLISGNSTAVLSIPAAYISSAVLAGGSSALTVRNVWSSTAADQTVRAVFSSTSTDNPVTISGNSTAVLSIPAAYISSAVLAGGSSALSVRNVWSSTSSDQPVLATIGTNLQSTVAPSSNSSGLIVRQVLDAVATFASTSAFATSTQATVSASTVQQKFVTAYSLTSTDQTPTIARFMSGSTLLWAVRMIAVSSGMTGANLAAGGGYLFKCNATSSLTLQINGSSRAGWCVSVGYYLAP